MEVSQIFSLIEEETNRIKDLPGPELINEKPTLRRRINAKKMLALNNSDFVEELYMSIMGRPGDANGIAHFNGLLESGTFTKEALLVEIRKSPEGMLYDTRVKGLSFSYWKMAFSWRVADFLNFLRRVKNILYIVLK